MTISVIIPTYNGAHRILLPLTSLTRQRFTRFEVIVVIDGSTDQTALVISEANLDLTIRVHQQENRGRAGSRNAGAALAKAPYLVFFDDDVEIPDFVLEKYFDLISKYSVIGGAFYPVYKVENEFSRYASYLNNTWNNNLPDCGVLKSPYISAANFLIERSLFEKYGGFNDGLSDAEDFDLAIRLFEGGNDIYFDQNIKVGHAIQESFKEYASRMLQYRNARKQLPIANPSIAKYLAAEIPIKRIKRNAYCFFSSRQYLTLMDTGFFRFLPQKVRFRLYNLVIYAYVLRYCK